MCQKCQKPHNTLLHIEMSTEEQVNNGVSDTLVQDIINQATSSTVNGFAGSCLNNSGLLSTAIVHVLDFNGRAHDCVALLDLCSQWNFISENMCKDLNLHLLSAHVNISRVNESLSSISKCTQVTIMSSPNEFKTNLNLFVAKRVTLNLPTELINISKLHIPNDVYLADPEFYRPKSVDILIGVEPFWELLCLEKTGYDYLHKTKLGYVVSGRLPRILKPKETIVCNFSMNLPDIHQQMEKLWNLEECP